MRIGVMSDTHGNMEVARIVLTNMGKIDLLLHAGDHFSDAQELAKKKLVPVYAVVGNCDWDLEKEDLLIKVGGKNIWLTHGHKYGVKSSHGRLVEHALKENIDIVVYGHTHAPVNQFEQGVLLFNPGSPTIPRGKKGPTYGIIEIHDQEIVPFIFGL